MKKLFTKKTQTPASIQKLLKLLMLTLFLWNAQALQAQDTNWNGSVSSDWFTAANWSNGVPDTNTGIARINFSLNTCIIGNGLTATTTSVVMNGGNFTIENGAVLDLDNAFGSGFRNDGGTFINNGTLMVDNVTAANGDIGLGFSTSSPNNTNNGNILIGTDGGNISYPIKMSLESSGVMNNNGLIRVETGGISIVSLGAAATLNNNACAQVIVDGGLDQGNGGTMTNVGYIKANSFQNLTNNGIIEDVNSNFSSTNNAIVIKPISSANCSAVFANALQNMTPNNFGIATTWYSDSGLSTVAGTYDAVSNVFTANASLPSGANTLYFEITDNVNSCTRTASLEATNNVDNTPPAITCPSNITVNNDPGLCAANVSYTTPVGTDNCSPTTTQIQGIASGNDFPVGTTTNTFEVSDGTQTAQCSFTVTVNDTEPPVFSFCPTNITQNTDVGNCDATVTWSNPILNDNCSTAMNGATVLHFRQNSVSRNVNNTLTDLGFSVTNVVNVNYNALGNNINSQAWDLVIAQITSNSLTANDITALSNHIAGGGKVIMNYWDMTGTSGVNPNSGPALRPIMGISNAVSFNNPKPFTAWATAHPIFNNPNTVSNIAVEGDNAGTDNGDRLEPDASSTVLGGFVATPTVNQGAIILGNNDNTFFHGFSSADMSADEWFDLIENEATFLFDLSFTQTAGLASGVSYPLGTTTNTLQAQDAAGNTANCSFTVTVNDNENPVALCPNVAPVVTLNAAGNGTLVANALAAGNSIDNCSVTSESSPATNFSCADIGTQTVVLTASDGTNSDTENCSVTVQAGSGTLQAICPSTPLVVTLDANGNATLAANALAVGNSTGSCGGLTESSPISNFTCADIGTATVVLTATDDTGSATANCSVSITDNIAPQITCPANMNVDTDAGNCDAVVIFTAPIGTDNCTANTTQTAGQASGATFSLGTTTQTFQVSDGSQSSNCSFNITVSDNEAPQITCPADMNVNTDAGNNTAVVTYTAPVGTDNCTASTSQTLGLASNATYPLGTTMNTFEVTDGNLTANCSFNITVSDNEAPQITCPTDINVNTDAGNCTAVVNYTAPVGTDNGTPTTTQTAGFGSGATFPTGTTVNTFEVTDGTQTANCSFNVVVTDNEAPQITCPADMNVNTDAGSCDAVVNYTAPVGTDNCTPTTTQTAGTASGSTYGIGTTTNTFEVTDGNLTANCSFNITVTDNEAPQITCPSDMNVNTDAGSCDAVVSYTAPVGTDNCTPTTTQTAGTASGSTYGIGTTTHTFEVTDGNLTANCSFNITVTDNEAPQITCPADMNVNTDAGNCTALINYTVPVGTDNCTPTTTQTAGFASGATYPVGTTTNTFEVTDGTATANCSFNVVVTDSENPMAMCQNISINLDAAGLASLTAAQIDNGSSDNCGTANLSIPPTTFSCSNQGANNVTLTVDDGNGNSNTCVAVVTVADPLGACCTAPQLSTTWTGALSNDWDDNANWTDCVPGAISAAIIPATATSPTIFSGTNALAERVNIQIGGQLDIEDGADLTIANSTVAGLVVRGTLNNAGIVSISDVGGHGIFSNTLNFTNAATGQIIINGVGAHGLRNDRRITNFGTISIDGVTASPRDGLNNEGGNTEFINHGNLFIGANGFIKTSAIANRFSGTFVNEVGGLVTIDDNNQFAAIDNVAGGNFTNRGTINMGLNGNLVLGIRNDVGSGAVFLNDTDAVLTIDNVGLDGISINSGTTFTNRGTISIGETIPLGRHGIHLLNSSTFNNEACAKVYVYDNFRNPSGTFNNDGFLFLETSQSHQTGAFNNNGTVNTVDSPLNNIVNNQINVSQSNVNSCVTEVSSAFDFGAAPTFTVLGVYTDDAATISAGTYDASTNIFTPTPATTLVSGTDYTYFVEIDEGACTSISEWVVRVNDTTNPTAICQDVSIQLDANGDASTIANVIDNGSTDACGVATLSLSQVSFDCSEEGTNTVTLTVTDNNGNSSTCNATVTVEDNLAPTVVVNDLTVYLDENGATNITTTDLNGGSFDNCGIATMLLSPASTNGATASFDCASVGTNTVTLTVIDVNGNVAAESATITVVDALPAEIECRQPISTTVTPGMCERMDLTVLEPFVLYDNCGIDAGISISRTPAINDFPVGTTVLTWTVTDSNGNDATCESLVIIEDNEAPVFNSYNTIIDFLEPNECSAQVTVEIDATDNCGIASIDGGGSFSLPFGIHEEMITITDMNGNVTTQDITIYVHDDQAPELVSCPEDIEIIANQAENAIDLPEPLFTDNCGFDELSNDAPTMFTEGTTTVTWTAEDTYGNTTECSYDVTITPSIFFTGEASPIEASTEEEGESSMVTWNRPEAITYCEACLVTDMPDFIFLGEFEGHQYFLYPSTTNWTDAVVLSEQINAQLVTINDVRENDFIQNQLPTTEEEVQYWTGLNYQNYDFAWLTDVAFDYVNFGFDPVLNFDVINAAVINTDGNWAMQTADMENGFIAERPCLDITQVAPIIETEDENGEIIETLLTPDADWAAGEYTVIYEATDMCDSTAVFSFGVTVQEPTADYCQTSGLDQEVWLDRVVFNDYMNESENNAGYADYTEEAVELLGENPVSVQLIPGGIDLELNDTPLYWRVFADWNNDGDFFDADEILHEQTSMNVVNVDFPAILNEEDLSVTIRIAVAKGEYPEACADYTTGETEDYALFFSAIELDEEGEDEENGFTIYPNPASDNVTIDLSNITETLVSLNITNSIGKVKYQQSVVALKQKNLWVNLRNLNNGIYFVNITTSKGEIFTERLVVGRAYNWSAKK